jgi:S-DNA-T family DNA segregation ATPase FtsK/SpoIIIE
VQLWWSVASPRLSRVVDVQVTAAPGTTFAEVRAHLLAAVGLPDGIVHGPGAPVDDTADVGRPPLLDGAALAVDAPIPAPAGPEVLRLDVVDGPMTGTVLPLLPGRQTLGRAAGVTLVLEDPDVSRLHAVLDVTESGVLVRDAGSANGTWVDGAPVDDPPKALAVGSVLNVGATTLRLTVPRDTPAATEPSGDGCIAVNRAPRLLRPAQPRTVTLPAAPVLRDPPRFPLVMVLIPLVLGAAMLVLLDSAVTFLLFVLLTPLMMLGNYVSERLIGRRSNRAAQAAYDTALAEAHRRADAALDEEAAWRRHCAPDPATVLSTVRTPGARIWERRPDDPDFLDVRLGLGSRDSDVVVRDPQAGDERDVRRTLNDVPITLPLRRAGVAGYAGPRTALLAAARAAVAQLAALHSPDDLALVIVAVPGALADWRWALWLPHLRAAPAHAGPAPEAPRVHAGAEQAAPTVSALVSELDRRTEAARLTGRSSQTHPKAVVVLLDGARELRSDAGITRLLREGPSHGIFGICLEERLAALPAECRATVELAGSPPEFELQEHGATALRGRAELVSEHWAHRLSRALAPLRDAAPAGDGAALPSSARLLDLVGEQVLDAAVLAGRWERRADTGVVLGVTAGGPMSVDLAHDGPHLLVAGTTGSGKSELLQTLLASLALAHRPDKMSFLLVDYKGGSAFGPCVRFPHTVGLVTDLDGALTERALTSLRAELRRREGLLRAAGAKDAEAYAHTAAAGQPTLARLVVVVDEFATLAAEVPEFVTGLVDVAMRGRSLGVHLVLATQRPGNAVTADIRANIALRMCLRVTDPAESRDVVDAVDAAAIPASAPGRAVARTASSLVPFQTARVGGRSQGAGQRVAVRRVRWDEPPGPRVAENAQPRDAVATSDGPDDLSRIAEATRRAARLLRVPPAPRPWLPPLPAAVACADLVPSGPWHLPLGLRDLPAEQRQEPFELDLARDSHLLLAGGPRSGRTTALRTLAGALAARVSPEDAQLYVLDCGSGSLLRTAALPHCGAAVGRTELSRGLRLLTRLGEEVRRRQELLSRGGFSSVTEQRADAPPDDRLPWMLVLLDSWEGFAAAYEPVDAVSGPDLLLALLKEGASAGIRAVVTADRGALGNRLGGAIPDRLLLAMPDPSDYALAGIQRRAVPPELPPGRALQPVTGTQVQLALLDPDPSGAAQQRALEQVAQSASDMHAASAREARRLVHRPLRVEPLPREVAARVLPNHAPPPAESPLWALVGVGGDDLAVTGVDLAAPSGSGLLVVGPAGSGRSTALRTMAMSLLVRGAHVAVVAPPSSPLRALPDDSDGAHLLDPSDLAALGALLARHEAPLVVCVDDERHLRGTPGESALAELLRLRPGPATAVIVSGDTAEVATSFRGLASDVRACCTGLVLQPRARTVTELFGLDTGGAAGALRGPDDRVPGRGLLVSRGTAVPVQVAV